MRVHYCRSRTEEELLQILKLQQANLAAKIPQEKQSSDGFVSAEHHYELLFEMNEVCPHVIAKADSRVIGYALCMHSRFETEIELLKPMFQQIRSVVDPNTSYMVMGQICVDEAFRKKGIFRGLYTYYMSELKNSYNCLITEVASNNLRSLNAHKNVGFDTVRVYQSHGISWELMKWAW